jgi:hypothetical protein
MEIHIQYRPDLQEMALAMRYVLFEKPIVKMLLFTVGILLGGSLFAALYYRLPEYWVASFNGLLLVGIGFLIYGYLLWTLKRSLLQNSKNQEIHHLRLNEKEIEQKGNSFEVTRRWHSIYQIKETKRWFLIYTQHNSALPIFKLQLQPDQIEAIRTLLKAVPVKKQLL